MKTHLSCLLATLTLLLISCASHIEPPRDFAWQSPIPPPEVSIDLPPEIREPADARFCQLGVGCLSMDARPFEPCLLSTKHCRNKAAEPMKARDGSVVLPMHPEFSARR